jgi:hypothetical protein
MRKNLFKPLVVGFLALSSLSLAYGQGAEYATVIINNPLNVTYGIEFEHSGNSFFPGVAPIPPKHDGVSFTGDFNPDVNPEENGAKFYLSADPNDPYCYLNSQQALGHCYVATFTYSKYLPVPNVEITDNSQPCTENCTIEYNSSNHNDIKVTINTSNK